MDKIKPALTPEEWEKGEIDDGNIDREHWHPRIWFNDELVWTENLHGLAALALHQQPFGFTHLDLDVLDNVFAGSYWEGSTSLIEAIADLRDRIEALLPPRPQNSP